MRRRVALPANIFGEGLALVGTRLFQLSWREGVAFDLNRQTPVREGWELQEGWKINDKGEIDVFGFKEELVKAFLLKAPKNRE